MIDTEYIRVLENKLADVALEISDLMKEVREHYAEIAKRQEQAQGILRLLQIEGHQVGEVDSEIVGQVNLTDFACEYLQGSGSEKPIHYRDLATELLKRGTIITGKDPAANLLSHISRDDRFVRVAPGTYGLAEWGLEPAKPRKRGKKRKSGS